MDGKKNLDFFEISLVTLCSIPLALFISLAFNKHWLHRAALWLGVSRQVPRCRCLESCDEYARL